eukprot:TRINITY_DN5597_c0_g1_i7.p1 TRINITY_DN5597_c0_g1~~TRINITY_DN5597_c0_g1_i7.p1  ORF type:complete len:274 (+),score=66.60 TRINITY_DN5597_c0_g1_i7:755-1576(+)
MFAGQWQHGQKHGRGISRSASGSVFVGQYAHNKRLEGYTARLSPGGVEAVLETYEHGVAIAEECISRAALEGYLTRATQLLLRKRKAQMEETSASKYDSLEGIPLRTSDPLLECEQAESVAGIQQSPRSKQAQKALALAHVVVYLLQAQKVYQKWLDETLNEHEAMQQLTAVPEVTGAEQKRHHHELGETLKLPDVFHKRRSDMYKAESACEQAQVLCASVLLCDGYPETTTDGGGLQPVLSAMPAAGVVGTFPPASAQYGDAKSLSQTCVLL